jgi:hypothetical protein
MVYSARIELLNFTFEGPGYDFQADNIYVGVQE